MPEKNLDSDNLMRENALLQETLNRYKVFLRSFLEACASMGLISDTDSLISFFVSRMSAIFGVNKVSFMLIDKTKEELFLKASEGLSVSGPEIKVKVGQAFGGWVAKNGDPLLVRDVDSEYPDLSRNRLSRYSTKSFVISPVKIKDDIIGILSLTDKKDGGAFSEEDLYMLTLFCRSLSLHIENVKLKEEGKVFAALDPLTGLISHRRFQEQLLEESGRAERYHRPFSLLIFDIDNFSAHNQDYGYSMGDSILKQVAAILKENTRKIDYVSRFGPEEFAIILPETKLKEALFVGEKIREKIAGRVFSEDRTSALEMLRITISVGVTQFAAGLGNEELVRQATVALLEAKQKGKNRVCAFK